MINAKILIIGRQNVGKSTIFNRLLKKRKAIVDSTPGVTRDISKGVISYKDIEFTIMDSGGFTLNEPGIEELVKHKILSEIQNADLLLYVVDINEQVPEDKMFAEKVLRFQKQTLLVGNKSDGIEKDILIHDFYNLGFNEGIPISASHNRNFDDLLEACYQAVVNSNKINENQIKKQDEPNNIIRLAILGKPNVGKSSLLNTLLDSDRAIVSDLPGTTRDIIEDEFNFKEKKIKVIDTAGIRRKSKVNEDVEYYSVNRSIKAILECDVCLLLLDPFNGVTDQDKKIAKQIINKGKACAMVVAKWDLVNDNRAFSDLKNNIRFHFPLVDYCPVIKISAINRSGIQNLLNTVCKLYENLTKKITTSQLNNFFKKAMENYDLRQKKLTFKIFYAVQAAEKGARFLLFCNQKKIPDYYKRYLVNRLRQQFDFSGVPVQLIFKSKS